MANITIEGKVIGQRRPLFEGWELPMLPSWENDAHSVSLRGLIEGVVHAEVEAFRLRQEQKSMIRALTQADIERGLMKGRIDPGGREKAGVVESDEAIRTAIQAFEDGLYYVFVDDEQQTHLDAPVPLRPESRVTFLRLVALAGG